MTPVEDETERIEKLRRDLDELKSSDAHYAEQINEVMDVKTKPPKALSSSKQQKTSADSRKRKTNSASHCFKTPVIPDDRQEQKESSKENEGNIPPQTHNEPVKPDQPFETQFSLNSTSSLFPPQQQPQFQSQQALLSSAKSVSYIDQNTTMRFSHPFNTQFRLNLTLIQQREQERGNNETMENVPPISRSAPVEPIQYIRAPPPPPNIPLSSLPVPPPPPPPPPPPGYQEQGQLIYPEPTFQLGQADIELVSVPNQMYVLPFGSATVPPLSVSMPLPSSSTQQQIGFINKNY